MSTAVASFAPSVERHLSPSSHFPAVVTASAAPQTSDREPVFKRVRSNPSPSPLEIASSSIADRASLAGKKSPLSAGASAPPVIKVKKEPASPQMSSRPRPKRLDLSSSTSASTSTATARGPQTGAQSSNPSAPLTSRESAGLQVLDVGLACLSPGFQTNDPGMREQLQRSLDVRDQQRQIIEARQKGTKPGSAHEADNPNRTQDSTLFGVQTRTPTTSRRKGAPPGLTIAAPNAAQFANDRVIQSAPINQTFTGLRPGDQAYSRHVQHGPSALSQMSHIHHVPATQTSNRLPPIADVLAKDRSEMQQSNYPTSTHSPPHAYAPPSAASPNFPSHQGLPGTRSREFRSAEEAVAGLSGGRDDLMPKVVHYGRLVQPPTPPSPMLGADNSSQPSYSSTGAQQQQHQPTARSYSNNSATYNSDGTSRLDILARTSSMNGRRRGREEFERDNESPPRSAQQHLPQRMEAKRTTFAAAEDDWRSGMSSTEKKEEFLRLCERAWDLFHS